MVEFHFIIYKSKEECMVNFRFNLESLFPLVIFLFYFKINEFISYGSRIVLVAEDTNMIKT